MVTEQYGLIGHEEFLRVARKPIPFGMQPVQWYGFPDRQRVIWRKKSKIIAYIMSQKITFRKKDVRNFEKILRILFNYILNVKNMANIFFSFNPLGHHRTIRLNSNNFPFFSRALHGGLMNLHEIQHEGDFVYHCQTLALQNQDIKCFSNQPLLK